MVRYSGNLFFKIFYNQLFEWSCFVRFDANTTIIPPSCCQDPVCWVLQPSIRSQPNWIGRGLSWFPPLYVDFCSSMSATYGITTADSHWCGVTVVIPQVHSLNAFAFTVYFISLLDQRRYVRCFNFFTEPMDSGHSHPTNFRRWGSDIRYCCCPIGIPPTPMVSRTNWLPDARLFFNSITLIRLGFRMTKRR